MKDRKLLNIELGRISAEQYRAAEPSGVEVILDNIRSAHNVGSVFRSADAFRIDKIWLCGITPLPPTAEIHKTALGAEESVRWEHRDDTTALVKALQADGYVVASVEQTEHSIPLGLALLGAAALENPAFAEIARTQYRKTERELRALPHVMISHIRELIDLLL